MALMRTPGETWCVPLNRSGLAKPSPLRDGVTDDREVLSARRRFEEPLGLKSLPLPTPRTRPCPPNSRWAPETPGRKDIVPGGKRSPYDACKGRKQRRGSRKAWILCRSIKPPENPDQSTGGPLGSGPELRSRRWGPVLPAGADTPPGTDCTAVTGA